MYSIVLVECVSVRKLNCQRWEPTLRMSETRKEVLADNFSCSIFAADNSCSSFSTFASASILWEYIFEGCGLPPSHMHLTSLKMSFLTLMKGVFSWVPWAAFTSSSVAFLTALLATFSPSMLLDPESAFTWSTNQLVGNVNLD